MTFIVSYFLFYLLGHWGGLNLPNTFISYIDASAMNKKYQTIKMIPRRLSSFHPFKWTDSSKNTTVDKSDTVEYVNPIEIQRKQNKTLRIREFKVLKMNIENRTRKFTFWNDIHMTAGINDRRLNEPWQTKTDQNVKYIRTNRIWNSHIAVSFFDNSHRT